MVVVRRLGALSFLFSVVTSGAASSPDNGHDVTRAVLEDEAYENSFYERSFGGLDERDLEDLAELDDEVLYARQRPYSPQRNSGRPRAKPPLDDPFPGPKPRPGRLPLPGSSQRKSRRPRAIRPADPVPPRPGKSKADPPPGLRPIGSKNPLLNPVGSKNPLLKSVGSKKKPKRSRARPSLPKIKPESPTQWIKQGKPKRKNQ
ncbi:unnamed protein product [Clonostachys byssicola]|uniref:Uncharacterized protein n=1 Tax=Clonostachys byssicola TaxID=160290 RepID=A0A9N9Y3C5_9HYPO|nr:unnamed protein product [Clonostachys byssicola]